MLYIVSTPIGNLEDITLRALRILKEADFIAAEDTRHSQILLNKYEIKTPTISFHSYSGEEKIEKITEILKEGKTVALISDAGTPGISDPAYKLIKSAIENGIEINAIPGASALLSALVVSGSHMNEFIYLGFLPLKKGRQTLLKSLAEEKRTLVIYESPHRILKTLSDLQNYIGDRKIAVCRELTKKFEETRRERISQSIAHFTEKNPKGEFVLVIYPEE
ncbi:MAG: 16S rRNA (cytidine(1402)-2'-O)-methyltransferase [Candidatus Gracilibacteria bacterium]|jgi:16S rRNA (cytidine1402-2'-O)-methyltransferase|nr:16S rRNA (cytidine(1402)-2'-O)-methyltransferase [Candidatus Gracilibacteria bacterium]